MALYKRGEKWWYEFEVRGQRVRETSNSANKEVATRVMRERRRALELNASGVQEMAQRLLVFGRRKGTGLIVNLTGFRKTRGFIRNSLSHLEPHFGGFAANGNSARTY